VSTGAGADTVNRHVNILRKYFTAVDRFSVKRLCGSGWLAIKNALIFCNTAEAEFCSFYHEKQKHLYFARQHKTELRFLENIFSIPFDPESYRQKESQPFEGAGETTSQDVATVFFQREASCIVLVGLKTCDVI
jgi:hypothetical protein